MLHRASIFHGYQLHALDDEIGHVRDFLFDDRHWAVRYVVVDTGGWLTGRRVLLSPHAMGVTNHAARNISTNLTKQQIAESPPLSSEQPVSRSFEEAHYEYFGWPMYWTGADGFGRYPFSVGEGADWNGAAPQQTPGNTPLLSISDVTGNHVHAVDGDIGHIEDFILDDETWAIRYLIIDTRNVWPGKRVLISPRWIERVTWSDGKVHIGMDRTSIENAPEYTSDLELSREYEERLHQHYARPSYWVDEPAGATRR